MAKTDCYRFVDTGLRTINKRRIGFMERVVVGRAHGSRARPQHTACTNTWPRRHAMGLRSRGYNGWTKRKTRGAHKRATKERNLLQRSRKHQRFDFAGRGAHGEEKKKRKGSPAGRHSKSQGQQSSSGQGQALFPCRGRADYRIANWAGRNLRTDDSIDGSLKYAAPCFCAACDY